MLCIEEILELEESLRDELNDHLEEILVRLNRSNQINDFLALIGLSELMGMEHNETSANDGKIIVIGQSEVDEDKLSAVAKYLGIDKKRFEFYLDYEDAKTFNFRKMQYNSDYSMILVGQMPHSGYAKGDYSSVITALEKQDGYPPVVRMGTKKLKITKASFRNTLKNLIQEKKIA